MGQLEMEEQRTTPSKMNPPPSDFIRCLVLIVLLQGALSIATAEVTAQSHGWNGTDYEALRAFKAKIQDPHGLMSSWNDSIHFCRWVGVTCDRRHGRVTMIDLMSKNLVGSLSPYIGNLSFLREIRLSTNTIRGEIPPQVGHLFRLQVLVLTNNSLVGQIPAELSNCSSLVEFDVTNNKLGGEIPAGLGSLSKLEALHLKRNKLRGEIPWSLGNLTSLQTFTATLNALEGSIPDSFGQLKNLTALGLAINNLSGTIPPSLYNLSSLTVLSLSENQLFGSLPSTIGLSFPLLQVLDVGDNQFWGQIPISLFNVSELESISIFQNNFTGTVPNAFGNLPNLFELDLYENNLGKGGADDLVFLESLFNCSVLETFDISVNRFGGSLPITVGNLSPQLGYFFVGGNFISGSIPSSIGNLQNLVMLDMSSNAFTGTIPGSIGKLQRLEWLSFSSNRLSGNIPSSLGNLTRLTKLFLHLNQLQGTIPPSLGKCKNLIAFFLYGNNLNGLIPDKLFTALSSIVALDLSSNQFNGSLPDSIGNLEALNTFNVSWNKLSGEIPSSLGRCTSLEELIMDHNFFQGYIPSTLSSLRGIRILDLSHNNLSGQIPNYLAGVPLTSLNLSYNNFDGQVPEDGIFSNGSIVSVVGNSRLCGDMSELHLPKCPGKNHKLSPLLSLAIGLSCGLVGVIAVLSFLLLWFKKKRKEQGVGNSQKESFLQISYESLLRTTGGFSASNLIGAGSFGSVYKGVIQENGKLVAIKVLHLQHHGALRSFIAECEALRNLRHRNLLKIITSCSSIDHQGNDFRALVYEYMENGSLENWLHPVEEAIDDSQAEVHQCLNLLTRINIAIDVASALVYLHHQSHKPIVHCDIKPSNVLLDAHMTGHVGDFGLAKILSDLSKPNENSTIGIKGTVGYAAPEYGMGSNVSMEGDVYSYGILLLEMITRKRPTDKKFDGGLSLHEFAKSALPNQVMDIIDPLLLREAEISDESRVEECLISIVKIGVACSAGWPKDRMDISKVVHELQWVRDVFQGTRAAK